LSHLPRHEFLWPKKAKHNYDESTIKRLRKGEIMSDEQSAEKPAENEQTTVGGQVVFTVTGEGSARYIPPAANANE
jgi:hypothetical protein